MRFLLLIGLPFLLDSHEDHSAGRRAVFQGRVVLGVKEGLPLKDVTVKAFQGTTVKANDTTDEDGVYELDLVAGEEYVFEASLVYQQPPAGGFITIKNYAKWAPKQTVKVVQGKALPTIIYPSPVLCQTGRKAASTSLSPVYNYLAKDPKTDAFKRKEGIPAFLYFPMPNKRQNAAGYHNDPLRVADHDKNGKLLLDWKTKQVDPVLGKKVKAGDLGKVAYSVVGHSLGGVIVRAFVTHKDAPPIHRIVSLDAPHGGVTIAAPRTPEAYAEWALNGMTTNINPPGPDPVYAAGDAGWNGGHKDLERDESWLLYSCEPNAAWDIIVPDESGEGAGRTMQLAAPFKTSGWLIPIVSGTVCTVDDDHRKVVTNSKRHQEIARFLAKGKAPDKEEGGSTSGLELPTDTWGQLSGVFSAVSGSSSTTTVAFDGNASVFGSVILEGELASYELRDSGGVPVPLLDWESVALDDHVFAESFEIAPPPTGPVTVELVAGAAADAALEYGFLFENERKVVAAYSPYMSSPGSVVQITAWIEDALSSVLAGSNAAATADILLPDDTTASLILFDDGVHGDGAAGDGVFGNTFSSTGLEGRYAAEFRLQLDIASETVERTLGSGFAVAPQSASLSGLPVESTPDANTNGLFDALVFEQLVSFARDGDFRLQATLEDGTGSVIAFLEQGFENTLGAGNATLELRVEGGVLVRHGIDGPWLLRDIVLMDLGAGTLPAATAPDFTTLAYALASFEPPSSPSVSVIHPNEGPAFGGNEVVVAGANLEVASQVRVDGIPAVFSVTGPDSLLVTIPPVGTGPPFLAAIRSARVVDLVVESPWGNATVAGGYRYAAQLQLR